jgi:hypothetical protein
MSPPRRRVAMSQGRIVLMSPQGGIVPMSAERRIVPICAVGMALLTLALAPPVSAQDFDLPAPAWPLAAVAGWFERALPPADATVVAEAGVTRWHGLDALVTRAVAAGVGWRTVRAGLGLSQTGEADVGWTALAAVAGAAFPRGGASVRAVSRRDRTSPFGFDAQGAAVGVEVGGGAWVEAAEGIHVWASAVQVWTHGAAPPLARPLEIGGAADLGGVTLWLSRSGVTGAARGGRAAGLTTTVGPLDAWLLARDQPLRGGLGLAARVRGLRVAAQIESHPVLRETARLAVGAGGGR